MTHAQAQTLLAHLWDVVSYLQRVCAYGPDFQSDAYQGMEALLIPLRLKHMANDAFEKSLKGTALVLPRPLTNS